MATKTSTCSMHADHEEWHSQHVIWLSEIEQWTAMSRSIMVHLSGLEAALREHCDAIELHQEGIEQLERNSEKHEQLIEADSARFSELQDNFSQLHVQEAKHQERQHEVHQQLKERQRELTTRIAALAKLADPLQVT